MVSVNYIGSAFNDSESNNDFWEGIFLLLNKRTYQITNYYKFDNDLNKDIVDIKLATLSNGKIHIVNSRENGAYMWIGTLESLDREYIESFISESVDWEETEGENFDKLINLQYFLEAVNNRRNKTTCINVFAGYFYEIVDKVLELAEGRTFSHPVDKMDLAIERTFTDFYNFTVNIILPKLVLDENDTNLEYVKSSSLRYRYAAEIKVKKFDEDMLIEIPDVIGVCSDRPVPLEVIGMAMHRELDHIIKSYFASSNLDLFNRIDVNDLSSYQVSVGFGEPSIIIDVEGLKEIYDGPCTFDHTALLSCFEFDALDVLASVFVQVKEPLVKKPKTWNLDITVVTTHAIAGRNSFRMNTDVELFQCPETIEFNISDDEGDLRWLAQSIQVKGLLAEFLNIHYDLYGRQNMLTSENFYVRENNVYLPYSEVLGYELV